MTGVLSVFRNRIVQLARGDEGVVLALSLAFMLPLFVLTICIYALQETLVRKAELQNAVDAAAYSAAVVQSDYFSRFALVNKVLGWAYVQRERARADYALIRLCEEGDRDKNRDLEYCRRNNDRSCCKKHKVLDVDYGVGTMTTSSMGGGGFFSRFKPTFEIPGKDNQEKERNKRRYNVRDGFTEGGLPLNQDTVPHYIFGNNVADPKTLTFSAVDNGKGGADTLATKINTYGETIKKCRTTFNKLKEEFDNAVEKSARDVLRLNLEQFGQDSYSQISVPKYDDLFESFTCSRADEKRLFEAAGFTDEESNDAQKVLGPGADRYFVLGSTLTDLTGPSWLGRRQQNLYSMGKKTLFQCVMLLVVTYILRNVWFGPFMLLAPWMRFLIAGMMVGYGVMVGKDQKKQVLDELELEVFDDRTDIHATRCSCQGDGPCRVLNFSGDKYLSIEWHFFWKRYVMFGIKGIHRCVPPTNFMGKNVGRHIWGVGRASIWGRSYGRADNKQRAIAGNPVVGKAIGAQGRKLKKAFFSPTGSIRVIAARDNPNPLRIFGGQDSLKTILKKIPGGKVEDIVKRYDAGGIYQIFNSHLPYGSHLNGNSFWGSQCPNFLFAVAAARIGMKSPTNNGAPYYLHPPTGMTATDDCYTLKCTDWEPFLVSFRGSAYDGWDRDVRNVSHPDGGGILSRLTGALQFEKEMRLGDWMWHQRSENHRNEAEWECKDLKKVGVDNLNILVRMNDTRGPYPSTIGDTNGTKGCSFLFWGLANEFINH